MTQKSQHAINIQRDLQQAGLNYLANRLEEALNDIDEQATAISNLNALAGSYRDRAEQLTTERDSLVNDLTAAQKRIAQLESELKHERSSNAAFTSRLAELESDLVEDDLVEPERKMPKLKKAAPRRPAAASKLGS